MPISEAAVSWYANKIKGGVAESACRAHFEALGYSVEAFGIEQIAPQYCKVANAAVPAGPALKNFAAGLQNMPDLLVSRIHPRTPLLESRQLAGHADAFLVDAKFRHSVCLEQFDHEVIDNYRNLIERKIDFYIYLVANRLRYNERGRYSECRVALGYFSHTHNKGRNGLWLYASDKKVKDEPLLQGMADGEDFATVYGKAIQPSLDYLLGSQLIPAEA